MKKIEFPHRTALAVAALLISAKAVSGVYVSADSIQPTTDHQIKLAEIEAAKAQTDALVRSTQSSEFMMGQLIEWQKAQQRRTDNKWEQTMQQRLVNDLKQEDILNQQNQLISERKSLEKNRIAMLNTYQRKESELDQRNAETMRAFYDERRAETQEFYNKQAEIQKKTLSLQEKVAKTNDELLAAQLKLNAPSNVVIASKDASNFTASVKPTDINTMGALSKTQTKIPLVNMNAFIESILPKDWRYTPPSDTSNTVISLVQGKDWKSIINQIAVQHPYIQFHIDPYKKQLSARKMREANSPKENSNVVRAWHISPSRSLRETIEHFATQANWRIIWDTQDIDYPIVAPAVVTTDFSGKQGIVNRLMKSTQAEDFPLFADWNRQNRVIVITRRGSTQK